MAERRVPRIRFKGFEEDWEQRKFSELVLIERGGSPRPIDNYITDAPDGLNWVKIGDAPAQGRYIFKTAEKIKPQGLSKTRQVQPGDLILSNSMSFGKPYIMGIHGCIHDGWLLIRDTGAKFDSKFLCHLLGSNQMLEQYRMFAAGSTVNNLNKELVGNTTVHIPVIQEQRVIGESLESIDKCISLHQRKLEKLKILKKAMLEKMFPKNGAKVPEIRFSGFTDDWEQRKLDEMASFSKGIGYSKADLRESGTPVILYGRLYTRYETTISVVDTFVGAKEGTVSSRGGEVIVPASGETAEEISIASVVGKPGILLGGDLNIIIPSKDLNSAFLAISVSHARPHDKLTKMAQGKSVVHLHNTDLRQVEIDLPSYEEQQEISNLFETLDSLLSLHQRKLEKLRQIKKSMLERMFV